MGKRPQSISGRTFSMTTLRANADLMAPLPTPFACPPFIARTDLPELSVRAIPSEKGLTPEARIHKAIVEDTPTVQSVE
jgi:hypothetical protein